MEGRRSSFKCCRHAPIYPNGDPCYGDATRDGLTNGDGDITWGEVQAQRADIAAWALGRTPR